jgi:hypothetical protein
MVADEERPESASRSENRPQHPRSSEAAQQSTRKTSSLNKKEAAPPTPKYAFESGVIRLTEKDFSRWQTSFSHLDVPAELEALAGWAEQQISWFNAVAGALAKRNRAAKEMKERQLNPPKFDPWGRPLRPDQPGQATYPTMSGMDGII